jgi:hypothetical protein
VIHNFSLLRLMAAVGGLSMFRLELLNGRIAPIYVNQGGKSRSRNQSFVQLAECGRSASPAKHPDRQRTAADPTRTFLYRIGVRVKASSPDHLVKNRLISSKNRAAAGSCFRKR